MDYSAEKHGFTLIELAIVLIIISVATGSVLLGKDLIRSAELRTINTDIEQYRIAAHSFTSKYKGIPGDIKNATLFWDAAPSCPTASSNIEHTCNGNGNNVIQNALGSNQYGEWFMFWQHLSLAGFYEDKYTGYAGPASFQDVIASKNVPKSRLAADTIFLLRHFDTLAFTQGFTFTNLMRNTLIIGKDQNSNLDGDVPVLTPSEMYRVDNKLDDGSPAYGHIQSFTSDRRPGCVTSNTARTAQYHNNSNNISCTFFYILDF